ncbi:helix-turn-helix transcriptional regulator [Microbacterium sp. P05]|uniref:AraC family transcriptional regulator n=1 Tax=Microbacterium sp. P05 TaxID=3366948 RepID=UPI003745C8DB
MVEQLQVRAQGVDAVAAVWHRFAPSARLHRMDPDDFSLEWSSFSMPDFTVVSCELTAEVQCTIEEHEQLLACRVSARGASVSSAGRTVDASLPWLSAAGATATARWSGKSRVHAFLFDRAAAERQARAMTGDDRFVLRTPDPAPVSAEAGRRWESSHRYLNTSLTAYGESEILDHELRRHALWSTLTTFHTSFLEAVQHTHQSRPAPAALRRATAFIDDHAHEPISLAAVAEAAGMSPRGLQLAFRRELDLTPREYLRQVRLAGAHKDLQNDPTPGVGRIALRWGFTNPSRFAAYYRAAYGVYPHATARST